MTKLPNPYRTRALLARQIRAAAEQATGTDPFAGICDTYFCAACRRTTNHTAGTCSDCKAVAA